MPFSASKTKIICTIGPASDSPEILKKMILAGMNVARLNFSHGNFSGHAESIKKIRAAAKAVGMRIAIMADLPGPKIRIGQLAEEPVELKAGNTITLAAESFVGSVDRLSVNFKHLPQSVKPEDKLYLNDGYIELRVESVKGNNILCKVIVGGELRSGKGLNLPGINLGISAFTNHDHECLKFAMEHGVDAVSQSFVEKAEDITAVRKAAAALGRDPFIIAKIERSGARNHLNEIIKAADGIMIARGDLGVEIPIERMALAQKKLIRMGNLMGKPVITATQMLESMTKYRRPTRAEATDVANAILDGTDCVMLSGESATGSYPVDAVAMLAKIAASIESQSFFLPIRKDLEAHQFEDDLKLEDLIALSVEAALKRVTASTVIVPTHSGTTARSIARFRFPVWITAVSSREKTCNDLMFSYGVCPVHEPRHPANWKTWANNWLKSQGKEGKLVILTEGPSEQYPHRNNRMEILDLAGL